VAINRGELHDLLAHPRTYDDSGVIGVDVWSSPSILCSEDLSMFVVCHPDAWWNLILLLSVSGKIYLMPILVR
jgi:hypothetical protein